MHTRVNHPELVFDGGQSAMDEARAEMLKICPTLRSNSDPPEKSSREETPLLLFFFFHG